MFAHEASFDCVFCGTHFCYGECRSDGENIVYGGNKRNLEVLPTLQATSSPGGVREGQVEAGRVTRALPEVSSGLPFVTKAYSRNYLARRNRFSNPNISAYGEVGPF